MHQLADPSRCEPVNGEKFINVASLIAFKHGATINFVNGLLISHVFRSLREIVNWKIPPTLGPFNGSISVFIIQVFHKYKIIISM